MVGTDLLKPDINELCLSCHDDNRRAPDVVALDLGSGAGRVRQAGALNRLGFGGAPGTGHTLGTLDTAPGSSPPWTAEDENGPGSGLNCLNCHAHHGRLQTGADTYRNLRPDVGHHERGEGLVTYNHEAPGANNLARDVFVRRSRDYDESAVDFNEPNARDSAMGRWCAGCHDQFHGRPGSEPIGGTQQRAQLRGLPAPSDRGRGHRRRRRRLVQPARPGRAPEPGQGDEFLRASGTRPAPTPRPPASVATRPTATATRSG